MNSTHHIEEQDLELYAMGRLAQEQLPPLEEHLLLCTDCQDRLEQFDQFIHAFRDAARRVPEPQVSLGTRIMQWITARPSYAMTALATAALALVFVMPRQPETTASYEVKLASTRGGQESGPTVPAQRRLDLTLDLRGVQARDSYHVDIAAIDGSVLFSTITNAANGELRVSTPKGFAPATYWVRVGEPAAPHGLLREFSLVVR